MMSFWDLSDGASAATNATGEFEVGGGNFEPIPAGSSVLAMADEVKWATKPITGERYISVRWVVLSPDEYKNRKQFHKLWVDDFDPEALKKGQDKAIAKRDKAKNMLANIDANAGGKLVQRLAQTNAMPTDDDLAMALLNKPMIITLMIVEGVDQNGNKTANNWVAAVSPKAKGIDVKPVRAIPKERVDFANGGDEIPF
jgi:hypothetical protein